MGSNSLVNIGSVVSPRRSRSTKKSVLSTFGSSESNILPSTHASSHHDAVPSWDPALNLHYVYKKGKVVGVVAFPGPSSAIGGGTFGGIVKGKFISHAHNAPIEVAVKLASDLDKESSARKALHTEHAAYEYLETRKDMDYISTYHGCVSEAGSNPTAIVLELYDTKDGWTDLFHYITDADQTVSDDEYRRTAWILFEQMMDCVRSLHKAGMYHQDFKPENFMVRVGASHNTHPTLRVVDFGLATRNVKENRRVGSMAYVGPEPLMRKAYNCSYNDLHQIAVSAMVMLLRGKYGLNIYARTSNPAYRTPFEKQPRIWGIHEVDNIDEGKFDEWCNVISRQYRRLQSPHTLFSYMLHSSNEPVISKAIAMYKSHSPMTFRKRRIAHKITLVS
jgi:serine/threonine protein kinase